MDENDELLIVDVTGQAWASEGFSDQATRWLHEHIAD